MRHIRRALDPTGYRFGFVAAAVCALSLWIIVVTALLDALAVRDGPDDYMRWVPDTAGHWMSAPVSLLLEQGLLAVSGPVEQYLGVSVVGLLQCQVFGAVLILLAGAIQTVLLFLLLRGPRRASTEPTQRKNRAHSSA